MAGHEVRFAAKMRLTTLLYAVPTKLVGFYVGMGVGGANIRELASFTSEGNSYHGGVGLEVNVSSRVSIASKVPGWGRAVKTPEFMRWKSARPS